MGSLGCFVWLLKDIFGRFGQEGESSTNKESLVDDDVGTTEEKVDLEKEFECHEQPSDSCVTEEPELPRVDVPSSSDVELLKSFAVQDVLDEVCQDIINNRDAVNEFEVPVSPSAC